MKKWFPRDPSGERYEDFDPSLRDDDEAALQYRLRRCADAHETQDFIHEYLSNGVSQAATDAIKVHLAHETK